GRAAGGRKKGWWRGGRVGGPALPPRRLAGTLALPLLLELRRRQVAQRRVDPLDVVHRLEEPADLPPGIGEIAALRQGNFFLLNRPHQPFRVAVLPRLADGGHADLGLAVVQTPDIVGGRVLHPLTRMMDLGGVLLQGRMPTGWRSWRDNSH